MPPGTSRVPSAAFSYSQPIGAGRPSSSMKGNVAVRTTDYESHVYLCSPTSLGDDLHNQEGKLMTMTDQESPVGPIEGTAPQGFVHYVLHFLQWLTFCAMLIFTTVAVSPLKYLNVPGAPKEWIFASVATGILILILHTPHVFWRLPSNGRWGAYAAIIGACVIVEGAFGEAKIAYRHTPEGAMEAAAEARDGAARAVEERRLAALQEEQNKTAQALAEAAETQKKVEEYAAKIEACFTTFGHRLPALEKSVKDNLHNPDAFEHVETVAIVPDAESNNVAMTFRAENGFGAVRTAIVRAQVVADGCEVQKIGEPEVS